jgi:TatA/E family protein of Tat protein translocase
MFLKGFEGWHILIIVGLLVVLFGARKLPDSARSIGQSLRIFKSEMKAAAQDGEDQQDPAHQTDQPTSPQPKALEHEAATSKTDNGGADAKSAPTGTHLLAHNAAELNGVPR